jgi:hypothetical protein
MMHLRNQVQDNKLRKILLLVFLGWFFAGGYENAG